jgi:hypothetical protein
MPRRHFIFVLIFAASFYFSSCQTINSNNDDNNGIEYYDNYENEVDYETSRVGVVEKEERFFGVTSVFEYLANPNNEAFFVIRMFFQARLLYLTET